MELPGRAPTWASPEGLALWWGVWRCIKRGDCPYSTRLEINNQSVEVVTRSSTEV